MGLYPEQGGSMKKLKILILSIVFCAVSFYSSTAAGPIDNTIYANLLKQYVSNGKVSYHGFKQDEFLLDQYLEQLSRTDIALLSEKEQFAFYINTYNAFTIKLILTRFPDIDSIKDLGGLFSSPWSIKFIPLQGKKVTLDHIEHDILRPEYKDPRVHFAVNCASKSCPALRDEPYEADRLYVQLDEQARQFINTPGHLLIKKNTLFISKIFKWFKQDFENGTTEFIQKYASNELNRQINAIKPGIKISFLDYDWSLNQ